MRTTRFGKLCIVAALGALTSLTIGCAAATDPSPSMTAISRSDAEIAKTYTMSSDTNMRQIIDDLERTFYTDRPSRLTPRAIPY